MTLDSSVGTIIAIAIAQKGVGAQKGAKLNVQCENRI